MKRVLGIVLLFALLCVGCGEDETKYVKVTPTTTGGQETSGGGETQITGGGSLPGPQTSGTPGQTYVVALDAGHGGVYGGATSDGYVEKTLNLSMALLVRDYLEEHYTGVTVYMIRETDTQLSENLVEDLEMRSEAAKQAGAAVYVSLHFNASDNHNQNGTFVYVSKQKNVNEACVALGTEIINRIAALGLANNGVVTRNSTDTYDDNGEPVDYYAVNRHGANRDMPSIIVEHCFMDNATDRVYMENDEALQALAKADAEGIAAYLGLQAK